MPNLYGKVALREKFRNELMLVSDRDGALEIVKAFSDDYSRRIILALISKALAVEEISAQERIPLSTCYRRVRELEVSGILRVNKPIIWKDGKKYICYKTTFKSASIDFDSGRLSVDIVPNRDPSEKLHDLWADIREHADNEEVIKTSEGISQEDDQLSGEQVIHQVHLVARRESIGGNTGSVR